MTSPSARTPETRPGELQVPRLESGDRLTREEFERRYDAMPDLKRAELVDGIVFLASPTRFRHHAKPHRHVSTWLGHYEAATPGVEGGDDSSLRLDLENEPQPDAFLRIAPERGGQSRTSEDDVVEGAPELVVEVSASTVSYDLHAKLRAYQRNGVLEYVVWRVEDEAIDWFVLAGGVYEKVAPDPAEVFRSGVFPGLCLDAPALLRGDIRAVLRRLDDGLRDPAHAAFVKRLTGAKPRRRRA